MRNLAWLDEGLCQQVGPAEFFPEKGSSTKTARAICAECPVKRECLEYALEIGDHYGVYGGLGERQRRTLLSQQNKGAAA